MEELKILDGTENYQREVGCKCKEKNKKYCKCKKYGGAKTVLIIKKYLENKGFKISQRDVFIKGLPNECDLLLLDTKDGKKLLYNPDEVKAVFEIKSTGIWSKSRKKLKGFVKKVKELNKEMKCIYIAKAEGKNSKGKVKKKNSNFEVFELFHYLKKHHSKIGNPTLKDDLESLKKKGKISEEDYNKLKNYNKFPNTNNNNWNGLLTYLATIK